MPHADGHRVFLQFLRHGLQPLRDGFTQKVLDLIGVKIGLNLLPHHLVGVHQPADFALSPAVKYGFGHIFQNRVHQGLHRLPVQVVDVPFHDVLHLVGVHQLLQLGAELPHLLVHPAAPGKTSGHGKLRLCPGDDHGFGECFPAPSPDFRHAGYAAGKEQQLRHISRDVLPHCPEAVHENLPEGPAFQLVRLLIKQERSDILIHPERQPHRVILADQHRLGAWIVLPVILLGEILFLKPAGRKLTVAPPGLALRKDPAYGLTEGGPCHRFLQQNLIHDAAAQAHFAGRLHLHLFAAADIGKVRGGAADIHHQHGF